jgi:hypothetical protein
MNEQEKLKLGLNTEVRDMTEDEKNYQLQMFILAERLQGEIAKQLRVLLGEPPYDQKLFDDAQRLRRVNALMDDAYSPVGNDPAAKHVAWCEKLATEGWTYGPEFNPALKQHNNLVHYNDLPATTKAKVAIFSAVAAHTVDVVAASLFELAYTEQVAAARVLATADIDENDVAEEAFGERLEAIGELLAGNRAPYTQQLLGLVQSIADRDGLVLDAGTMEAVKEALA